MGVNVSIYLSDTALAKLDAAVAKQAAQDRSAGFTGRKVASRSSVIEHLITEQLDSDNVLDRETIRYYVASLGEKYGARKISLFGSYARGEATASSDIDILLDKGSIRGMQVLDFQEALAEKLGRPVDVVTTAGASVRFLDKIRPDEVVLYEAR